MADEATRKLRHDLRTPLNQIIGYSELLIEEAEERGQPDLVPDLRKIGAAAHDLAGAVERMLDASAPGLGRARVARGPVAAGERGSRRGARGHGTRR